MLAYAHAGQKTAIFLMQTNGLLPRSCGHTGWVFGMGDLSFAELASDISGAEPLQMPYSVNQIKFTCMVIADYYLVVLAAMSQNNAGGEVS